MECFFSIITRQAIRRGSYTSVRQLTQTIGAFIDRWNDHPRPFAWTKDADEILGKIHRAKTKTNALTDRWHASTADVRTDSLTWEPHATSTDSAIWRHSAVDH